MSTSTQYAPQYASQYTLPNEIDPQGIIGSFLGKMAGGFIGKQIGGGTGQTVGSIGGGILGSFIPFSAGPQAPAQQQPAVSDIELQSFWNTFKKIASTVADVAKTGYTVGQNLGLLDAGPQAAQQQQPAVSDIELQSFWNTFTKIASTVANVAKTGYDVGHGLGMFQAGPQAAQQQQPAVSDIEMQGFWSTFTKIANTVKTGYDLGHNLGLYQASPQPAQSQANGSQPAPVSETELQSFWNVLNKIGSVVSSAGQPGAGQAAAQGRQQTISQDQAMAILRQVSPVLQTLLQQRGDGTLH
jgi:diadenosine tetraphosphate (Ap4A) HIT family hydrolase